MYNNKTPLYVRCTNGLDDCIRKLLSVLFSLMLLPLIILLKLLLSSDETPFSALMSWTPSSRTLIQDPGLEVSASLF